MTFFGSISTVLLALIAIVSAGIYFYVTLYTYSYWKRLGVIEIQPSFPFGNFRSAFLQTTHIGVHFQDVYKKTKEPFLGLYSGLKPILMVNDPELVRLVFIKDFQNFHDRGMYIDEERDPLSAHLFSMNGEKWKNLRNKLSPTFTSGKLKAECTKDWGIPNTDVVVKKGIQVVFPAYALQRDEKYYPDPDKFIPERFNAENSLGKTFVDRSYMPFGEGPRVCIGMRLGKMQSKVGLLLMLKNYNFELTRSTLEPLKVNPSAFTVAPIGGLPLKVTKR